MSALKHEGPATLVIDGVRFEGVTMGVDLGRPGGDRAVVAGVVVGPADDGRVELTMTVDTGVLDELLASVARHAEEMHESAIRATIPPDVARSCFHEGCLPARFVGEMGGSRWCAHSWGCGR